MLLLLLCLTANQSTDDLRKNLSSSGPAVSMNQSVEYNN